MFNHNSDKTETVDEKLPLRKLPKLLVDLTSTERLNPREYTQQSIGSKTNDKQTCSVRKSKCKFVTAGGRDLFDFNVDPADLTMVTESSQVRFSPVDVFDSHEATQVEKTTVGDAVTDLIADGAKL